ncbi:MAG TPA: MarR family transcriptional regulator [Eoetvoesiella sp.]|uniref:MarR family winged helix-turn-helix transcriptional regulator n=1 Tax=Eoetvoesiella sp. TaxID=1966355 RepID=UPI002BA48249|nr:MarR family transcriptional regulator [Eoetvoesiella sp.]HWK60385.1 MarR family transcriptional regulator [Eoetvoesiella sp.]
MENTPVPKKAATARRRPRAARAVGEHENIQSWRRHNVGRLLNNAINRFESRILELMDDAGHGGFSLSHIAITRNLDIDGTRATDLAKRAGITKQSVGELIVQLEAGGVIARKPDPSDKRSRIVFFTPLGVEWLNAFRTALQQAEAEMEDELGAQRLNLLKQALTDYGGK